MAVSLNDAGAPAILHLAQNSDAYAFFMGNFLVYC